MNKACMLLIEDGQEDAAVYQQKLEQAGYEVDRCLTVDEAIAKLTAGTTYAGIMCDVAKMGRSGLALVEWLNQFMVKHPPLLLHSSQVYFGNVDLHSFNEAPCNIIFRHKASLRDGSKPASYRYIDDWLEHHVP